MRRDTEPTPGVPEKTRAQHFSHEPLKVLVGRVGIEPTTNGLRGLPERRYMCREQLQSIIRCAYRDRRHCRLTRWWSMGWELHRSPSRRLTYRHAHPPWRLILRRPPSLPRVPTHCLARCRLQ